MAKFRLHDMPSEARLPLEEALGSVALTDEATGAKTLKHHLDATEAAELEYFNVSPEELHKLASLRALEPKGWAVVVRTTETIEHDSDYSLAHIARRDGRFRFTHLQHGWVPKAVLLTLDRSSGNRWLASQSFTPALLHVMGLQNLWLWCRAKNEIQDRLFPLRHDHQHPAARLRAISAFVLQKRLGSDWSNHPRVSNAPGTAHPPAELVQIQPPTDRRSGHGPAQPVGPRSS